MFELYQLRCFVAVAEELHFGRAAQRMNLTQPPLSRQVQMLEAEVGVRLLQRNKRVVRLTPAGRVFLHDARHVLERAQTAVNRARMAERGQDGALTLGFTALASVALMPKLVAAAREEHPGIALVLHEMLSTEQEQWLLAGQLDLGLLRPPVRNAELSSMLVHEEQFVLAVAGDSPLSRRPRLDLHALSGERFIMYSPEEAKSFFDLLTGLFQQAGVITDIVQYAGTPYAILSLVGAGLGAALVPASARGFPATNVQFLPITLPRRASIEFLIAWRRLNDNPALSCILRMVERLAQAGALNDIDVQP